MTEQNEKILDNDFEVHHVIFIMIETTTHNTYTALHLEIAFLMIRVLLLHYILVHDMTITKAIRDLIVSIPQKT